MPVKGKVRCVVVAPKEPAAGNPWSWRGYDFDHEPQAEIELLRRGFHVGFVGCDAGKPRDAWYKFLTGTHGLSKRPAFIGMSRGGRNAYAWATANPDKVSCIYAENPILRGHMRRAQPLDRLAPLVRSAVPVLHVCGSLDPWLDSQTRVLDKRYRALGGHVTVIVEEGKGHYPTAPRDLEPVVAFIAQGR